MVVHPVAVPAGKGAGFARRPILEEELQEPDRMLVLWRTYLTIIHTEPPTRGKCGKCKHSGWLWKEAKT